MRFIYRLTQLWSAVCTSIVGGDHYTSCTCSAHCWAQRRRYFMYFVQYVTIECVFKCSNLDQTLRGWRPNIPNLGIWAYLRFQRRTRYCIHFVSCVIVIGDCALDFTLNYAPTYSSTHCTRISKMVRPPSLLKIWNWANFLECFVGNHFCSLKAFPNLGTMLGSNLVP